MGFGVHGERGYCTTNLLRIVRILLRTSDPVSQSYSETHAFIRSILLDDESRLRGNWLRALSNGVEAGFPFEQRTG